MKSPIYEESNQLSNNDLNHYGKKVGELGIGTYGTVYLDCNDIDCFAVKKIKRVSLDIDYY